ncbi:MAG TPA: condensation domain-containing protein [Thermoanaerobaculia bacterium]|nr:condensation domain-containing protein [Thermoanaerobaculia bacterium]
MSEIPAESIPRVAVVGLAGRYPGARTIDELWRNLQGGVESISHFTPEELAAGVDPRLLADPRYVRAKGVLPDADLFDAAFFGFTPREAEQMDPQHRVFLECAWEALEDAGCDPQRLGGRVGVYAGSGASAYLISNLLPHRELAEKAGVLQLLLLNDRDFLATRTSYKLGLMGPSVAVQSACSTSLVAIHLACQALLTGECDLALTGGVSISTPLANGYLYQEGSILSPDGHCRAFDASAAGSVDANGCGVVALKRLSDAVADGDRIYAVVLGSAVTNDGPARVGFTAPGVDGQAAAISEALLLADVDPDTIGYVQTHGSGTALGDPIEVEALTRAFRRAGAQGTGACAIGSVKTNLGHCSAAAGVAGFIAATLALRHRTLPPSLHYESPNPRIDFAASPFYVCSAATPWETDGNPRRAGVSAFGLGGTNAHIVLEEAPEPEPSDAPSRQPQLVVLSARTPETLEAATARLADRLESLQSLQSLADVSWTLQTGRHGFEHRRFVVARDPESAAAALRDPARTVTACCDGDGRRSVVFLFPGLGDQAVDMAREIYETEPFFREQVDLCAAKLTPWLGCDLREVLFSPGDWKPASAAGGGPDLKALLRREPRPDDPAAARLDQTAFAQPACFVVEYALGRLLMEWGIDPAAMIGYSIGEYVAACLAGSLSLDDALLLVARRARLIQDLPPGAMLAVPLAEEEVRPLLDERLSVSATNGPNFCVVGGPEEAVAALEATLAGRGASCLRLQTTHAFHSAMMDPAAGPLTELAAQMQPAGSRRSQQGAAGSAGFQPAIPYLSNVTGTWITPEDLSDPGYWARHMRGTVRFAEGLSELLREPGRAYVEVGPGGTLGTLVRQHPGSVSNGEADLVTVPTLRRTGGSGSDLDDLVAAVGRLWAAGVEIDWERFHGGARRLRTALPTYPFERKRFWIDPPAAGTPAAPSIEPRRTADLADWFWVPSWKQVPLVRPAAQGSESWLIFLDENGLGERLAGRLRGEGHTVATVAAGPEFDPRRPQDYAELVARMAGDLPTRILHLWGVTAEEPSYEDAQVRGLLSLVFLEQAITGAAADGPAIRIALVVNGLYDEPDGAPLHPAKATALGAVQVLHQESERLTCSSLHVSLPAPGSRQEEILLDQILAEMDAGPEPAVAFVGRQRWVRSFEPVHLETASNGPLVPGGTYLVVASAQGPGVAVADDLVRSLGARVALVLPPQVSAIRHLPQLQEEAGPDRLLTLHAEANEPSLRAALDQARDRFGPVQGAIYAAGSFTAGLVQLKSPEILGEAIDPVARGALALLAAAQGQPELETIVLCASSFTATGGLGQVEIAAAGSFLDVLALQGSARGGPSVVAVHWDPYQWDGWLAGNAAGLGVLSAEEVRKSLETYGVPSETSGEALRRLLASGLPRVIVTARHLPALIEEAGAVTADSLLAQMGPAPSGTKAPRPALPTPYAAPRNDTEAAVARVWQELFGIEPIGIHDNFLELGGHSLLAIQIMTHLRTALDNDLPVTALFENPTIAGLAGAVARARGEESAEDLEALLAFVEGLSKEEALEVLARPAAAPQPPPVQPVSGPSGAGDWPLSFDQERLLRMHLDNPELVSWNVDVGSRIHGPLQVPHLLAAFAAIVQRHAAWRTTFPVVDGQRVQRVHPWMAPHFTLIDLTALPAERREAAGREALFERTRALFDLERGPLVRVSLARLHERDHLSQFTIHHLVTDWITFHVCWRELLAIYDAHRNGRPPALPPLPVQYPDFVLWEREWLQGEVLRQETEFWQRELEGFPLALELPTDKPRPAVQSQRGGLLHIQAGHERTERLRALARQEGVTMFMVLLAVLDALLHRVSGHEKIVVGSNSANRPRPELESVFGLFLTQVPFPVDVGGDPTFRELLGRVRRSALSVYAHQNLPISRLIEALGVEPDPSRSPVVQALLLVLEGQSVLRAGDLDFEAVPLFDGNSRWDLMFAVYDYHDVGLSGPFEYNADIFEASTAERLLELFYELIDAVTADPDVRLSRLPALHAAEEVLQGVLA